MFLNKGGYIIKKSNIGFLIFSLGIALISLELYGLSFLDLLDTYGETWIKASDYLKEPNIILSIILSFSIFLFGLVLIIVEYKKNHKSN